MGHFSLISSLFVAVYQKCGLLRRRMARLWGRAQGGGVPPSQWGAHHPPPPHGPLPCSECDRLHQTQRCVQHCHGRYGRVEIFCVPTCSVRTPRKEITLASSISVLH